MFLFRVFLLWNDARFKLRLNFFFEFFIWQQKNNIRELNFVLYYKFKDKKNRAPFLGLFKSQWNAFTRQKKKGKINISDFSYYFVVFFFKLFFKNKLFIMSRFGVCLEDIRVFWNILCLSYHVIMVFPWFTVVMTVPATYRWDFLGGSALTFLHQQRKKNSLKYSF